MTQTWTTYARKLEARNRRAFALATTLRLPVPSRGRSVDVTAARTPKDKVIIEVPFRAFPWEKTTDVECGGGTILSVQYTALYQHPDLEVRGDFYLPGPLAHTLSLKGRRRLASWLTVSYLSWLDLEKPDHQKALEAIPKIIKPLARQLRQPSPDWAIIDTMIKKWDALLRTL